VLAEELGGRDEAARSRDQAVRAGRRALLRRARQSRRRRRSRAAPAPIAARLAGPGALLERLPGLRREEPFLLEEIAEREVQTVCAGAALLGEAGLEDFLRESALGHGALRDIELGELRGHGSPPKHSP